MKTELSQSSLTLRRFTLGLALSAVCSVALGHQETGQTAGLVSGLSHPLSGLDSVTRAG